MKGLVIAHKRHFVLNKLSPPALARSETGGKHYHLGHMHVQQTSCKTSLHANSTQNLLLLLQNKVPRLHICHFQQLFTIRTLLSDIVFLDKSEQMQTRINTASVGKEITLCNEKMPQPSTMTRVVKPNYMFTILNIGKIPIGSCVSGVPVPRRSLRLSTNVGIEIQSDDGVCNPVAL